MRGCLRSGGVWLMLDSEIWPAVGLAPTVLWRSLSLGFRRLCVLEAMVYATTQPV